MKHDLEGHEFVRFVHIFCYSKHEIEVLLIMELNRVQLDRSNILLLTWTDLSFDFESQRDSFRISWREDSHTNMHILPESNGKSVVVMRMLSVILNEVDYANSIP